MTVSRREVLVGAAAVACASAMPARSSLAQAAVAAALPTLAILDARQTMAFALDAVAGQTEFVEGMASPTLGFNQAYLGPIVLVPSTATVHAAVTNGTDRTISVHWHGLLVPGDVDGGPHQPIAPGETWSPTLPIDQKRATLWFHTHVHGATAEGVYAGLAGVLLLDDGLDTQRGLPAALGVDDLVLVIQDKRFDAAGRASYEPTAGDKMHGFLGDTILVNGAMQPAATVPAGIVKLRLLNASNGRNFGFFFDDGRPLHIVASEQGLLPAPIAVDRLRLSPGERTEVLVAFSDGAAATLMSHPHDEGTGASGMTHDMPGMVANEERFTAPFAVMTFQTSSDLLAAVTMIPTSFVVADEAPPRPTTNRTIALNDMGDLAAAGPTGSLLDALRNAPPVDHAAHAMPEMAAPAEATPGTPVMGATPATGNEPVFGINGQPFDMDRIDVEVAAGSSERWVVGASMMGHPFHIHGARFQVLRDKGGDPRPENRGWKDTVFVDGEVEILIQFADPATASAPFMFHCHVLEHEDRGMMGQFTVGEVTPVEYRFEVVDQPAWDAGVVRFSVQLVAAATGQPVPDAAIRVIDFNMEPEGMAGGVGVQALPIIQPGVQPFDAIPSMGGRWALVLEAALPDGAVERETLILRMPDRP